MYGWRARLGFLLPVDNAVLEPEAGLVGLPGVSSYVVRLTTTERSAMPGNGVALAPLFTELGVDVVGYACAETSFLGDTDVNRWIEQEAAAACGIPVVSASSAMLAALRALDLHRVAVATPYPRASTDALVAMLERGGVEVVNVASTDLVSGAGGQREWARTNEQPPATAAGLARDAAVPSAEGVLISATNLRTAEVITAAERDLDMPVISSNTALLWAMLGAAGIQASPPWFGALAGVRP